MSEALPDPLVPPDVDVRDLDGFMLNVERLMASELVALSSHEVIAGSLFIWCRAWKQIPAASLPDDDRVIAAFSRLSPARYRKLKEEILRGFVKCSDGRLYHRVLAEEAITAFTRKSAFRDRRAKDAERLRTWRQKQDRNGRETRGETGSETQNETNGETRFVREGQGQGRDGTGTGPKEEREARAGATTPPDLAGEPIQSSKRGRSSKDLVPWPSDLELTAPMREYATKHGFDPDWLFEKFQNKAESKGWVYKDWPAAFRNFAQTEQAYTPTNRSNGARQDEAWRPPDV